MPRFSLLLGSIHDYHDVQHFIDTMEHVQDVDSVNCTYLTKEHHFRLSFNSSDGEKAALNLTKAMQEYTDNSRWDSDDDMNGQLKVSMTSDARLKEELDSMYDAVDQMAPFRLGEGTTPTQPAFLINHESFQRSWTITSRAPNALLARKFLSCLEQAWNIRIELIDMAVTLYADESRVLESAIEAFTACQQAMVDRERRRHFFDFHNDEDETGRFYRARLPSSTADYELSRRSFRDRNVELIMVQWDDASRQYVSLQVQTKAIIAYERSCLWPALFKFRFGDSPKKRDKLGNNDGYHITNLPTIEDIQMDPGTGSNDQVKSWLETNLQEPSVTGDNHKEEYYSSMPSSQLSSQLSQDQGSLTADCKVAISTEQLQEKDALQHDDLVRTGYIRPSRVRAKRVEDTAEAPLTAVPRLIGPNSGTSKSTATTFPTSEQFVSTAQEHTKHHAVDLLRSADFPLLPGIKSATTRATVCASGAWTVKQPLGLQLRGPPGNHWPVELPKQPVVTKDTLVVESDEEKRCFHPQGSQKVSRNGAKPKPFDLSQEVWKALRTTLGGVKLRNSVNRTIKLEIGKIFISATSIPPQWRPSRIQPAVPFKPEHWCEVFHAHRDRGAAITLFSPQITDRWGDAEHIIELETAKNAKIFASLRDDGMPEQRTRLRIHCRDKRHGTDAIVEIDDAKKASIYAADTHLVASVSIHYPKRAWDARIIVEEQLGTDSRTTQPFRSLIDALCVRAPRKDQHLKDPIVAAEKDAQIDILSVDFHRDVIYAIDGPEYAGANLYLTQVQSLLVNKDTTSFSAYLKPEKTMIRDGCMWWTMYISSHSTNMELQQDAIKLRIGESLKPEALDKFEKPVQNLLDLGNLLVPLMDPVGMHTSFHCSSGSSSSPHKGANSSRGRRSSGKSRHESREFGSQVSGR